MTHTRHDCEVILVGDELLRGERNDAHLAYIARALSGIGVRVDAAHVVGDDVGRIAALVGDRLAHTRALLVTGGLGPTEDDITREGVADAAGMPLAFREDEWAGIEAFFVARGRTPTEANRRQAYFPGGADVIPNTRGTAPGFTLTVGETAVFVLPGPPPELRPMLDAFVVPRLALAFGRAALRVETFRTIGIGESQLVEMLGDTAFQLSAYSVSWLPHVSGVDVVLTARRDASADQLDAESARLSERMQAELGTRFYEHGTRPIAKVIGENLKTHGETVAVAESLTGGSIARLMTAHPGASEYFLASAVAYANASKTELLGVRADTITAFGAVSEETCTEMAHGIRRRAGATWGIATTGIAGPDGGTPHKPVGLTFIGVAWDGGSQVRRVMYAGERDVIRDRAAHGALWLLYDRLQRRS